ncbi:hypothetical protein HAX54_046127 [Datura stramonium]|uniref:Uncharacterized protein n=1 Tax=Datura stramonium TaxID=4076 RepID=A0ABS8SRA9_DATST|nr:hypothetical protein [Datura stramonium]
MVGEKDACPNPTLPFIQRTNQGIHCAQVQKSLLLRDIAVNEHVEGTEKSATTTGLGRAREKHKLGFNENKKGEWAKKSLEEQSDLRVIGPDYASQGTMQSSGKKSTYTAALINSIEGEARSTGVDQIEIADRARRGVDEEGEGTGNNKLIASQKLQ